MGVNLPPLAELLPIDGISLGTAAGGIKYQERKDVAVALLAAGSVVGGVFTRNAFRAAPVVVASERLGHARALLVNSGNANAATGERGIADARACCAHLAAKAGLEEAAVLPFSTGVIGEFLPMDAMRKGIDAALLAAHPNGWAEALAGDDHGRGSERIARTHAADHAAFGQQRNGDVLAFLVLDAAGRCA